MISQIKPPDGNIKAASTQAAKKAAKKKPAIPKKITATYLHNSGLYYLQRFAASSAQFRRVMMRKVDKSCMHHTDQDREECGKLVDALVETFQHAGLLNDEAFARGLAISLRRRGQSTRAIEAKMKMRGLSSDEIARAMDAYAEESGDSNPDLIAALRLARRRKAGPFAAVPGDIEDKTLAAFARAGFSYELAQRVLGMSREDAENLLSGGSL